MKQEFFLEAPGKVLAGAGAVSRISEILAGIEKKEGIILTDRGIRSSGIVDTVAGYLAKAGWALHIVDSIEREPDIANANDVIGECRTHACGAIIGVGGGSVLDIAKLLGSEYHTGRFLDGLTDSDRMYSRTTPTCLIPTTAGTGSEATKNVILATAGRKLKNAIISSQFLPDSVILDPELTLSMPPGVTAATGVDALAHALECYLSLKATPLSDVLALDAMARINRSIEKAFADGTDIAARTDMLLAAFYGGMCISLSGTTAVHALSYPLGASFHIPHGVANAMLLAPVIDFNKDAVTDKLCRAGSSFGLPEARRPDLAADAIVERLYSLVAALRIPKRLAEFGIAHRDIGALIEGAIGNARLMNNNPKLMTRDDIRRIYEQIQ